MSRIFTTAQRYGIKRKVERGREERGERKRGKNYRLKSCPIIFFIYLPHENDKHTIASSPPGILPGVR
jgi:hypothetical protein